LSKKFGETILMETNIFFGKQGFHSLLSESFTDPQNMSAS
jgi:hypothetical protein